MTRRALSAIIAERVEPSARPQEVDLMTAELIDEQRPELCSR
jgi:hypothetical protein